MPRRAARKDNNHDIIREAVRAAGYWWHDTFQLGDGYPDANVLSKSNRLLMVEIKSPGEKLTEPERKFHDNFPGMIEIWRYPEQALDRLALYWDDND